MSLYVTVGGTGIEVTSSQEKEQVPPGPEEASPDPTGIQQESQLLLPSPGEGMGMRYEWGAALVLGPQGDLWECSCTTGVIFYPLLVFVIACGPV